MRLRARPWGQAADRREIYLDVVLATVYVGSVLVTLETRLVRDIEAGGGGGGVGACVGGGVGGGVDGGVVEGVGGKVEQGE